MEERDSLFNAGRGAVFTNDGRNELDAAIMDGPHPPGWGGGRGHHRPEPHSPWPGR